MKVDIGRTNGFVRILRVLLGLEGIRRGRQIGIPQLRLDPLTHTGNRIWRDAGRVSTHVSDETDCAFAGDLNAFVKTLRHPHGALDIEPKLARSILLQLAGSEWRGRVAPALLAI